MTSPIFSTLMLNQLTTCYDCCVAQAMWRTISKIIGAHFFLETQYKHRYLYTYEHYPYEHTYAHPISMSTSERLSWLDLEIHEISHQERIVVDGDVASH
jgi:hypothetical protein